MQNTEKILTVVVPVYNTEKYMKRCLDSVLIDEVLDDVEILIVNDGSTDNSMEIAREYQAKCPMTIRIIDKENGGHGSTINVGMREAIGKYLRVLDSDDWFNSEDYCTYVHRLKDETADVVLTNYRQEHVYESKSVKLNYDGLVDGKQYIFDDLDMAILKGEYFVMATSTYRTEVLRQANFKLFEKTPYVDMQFNIFPVPFVNTFTFYELDIYRYFIGRADQTVNLNSFIRNQDAHEKVVKSIIEFYQNESPKWSDLKREYIKLIIKYLLHTHYTIYCLYDTKNKATAYTKIKDFDAWLYNISPEIYLMMNEMTYIQYHRKTKFNFVKINGVMFDKVFRKLATLKR